MADEPEVLPPARIVRWMAIAVAVLAAVFLYFRYGRDLPPLGATPEGRPAVPAAR